MEGSDLVCEECRRRDDEDMQEQVELEAAMNERWAYEAELDARRKKEQAAEARKADSAGRLRDEIS